MAMSSLYKNFVISSQEEAKRLVDMLETFDENEKNSRTSCPQLRTVKR